MATLPESELSSYSSSTIPFQWVGLEISADDILIFDGGANVDPILCDLSSSAGTSVSELFIILFFWVVSSSQEIGKLAQNIR